MSYLRAFPQFGELTDEDVRILERLMVVESQGPNHVYLREGDRATAVNAAMYLVLWGEVEVVAHAPEGGFGIRKKMGPGEMFGLVAFVAEQRRTATVRATGEVRTARMDRRTFDALYNQHVGVHARFQMVVARQLAADIRTTGLLLAGAIATGNCDPLAEKFRPS